jgi:hypothetical protein
MKTKYEIEKRLAEIKEDVEELKTITDKKTREFALVIWAARKTDLEWVLSDDPEPAKADPGAEVGGTD